MRRFSLGSGPERKVVVIELEGSRMTVVLVMPDGSTKRTQRDLVSESAARAASDQMARELIGRGFKEKIARAVKQAKETARSAEQDLRAQLLEDSSLFDDMEPTETDQPVLARLAAVPAPTPSVAETPKKAKKKAGGKKKRKKAEGGDALDKRVLAAIGAVVAALFGIAGFMAYDVFFKPATIVGVWRGSMIEHEISKKLTHTRYDLILDNDRRASLTLQQKYTTTGTYSLKGDLLKLSLRDEDGRSDEREYKFKLDSVSLQLFDPDKNEMVVELQRSFTDAPVIGGKSSAPKAPTDLGEGDTSADETLASVDFSPKDSAFRMRYPKGWEHETGSRPDNTYSWGKFTSGSATIDVYADIQGSLMSGSDSNREPQPEGSEFAPVHRAHELYKKTASESFNDYSESDPAVFKGSKLGEGRIAQFTATEGGLFKSKVRGLRVTLLTNDRRITILCHCPDKEFAKHKPMFLAVCRSLSR
jgi:hypothetical protein